MEVAFVFTASVCILLVFKFTSIIVGQTTLSLPQILPLEPLSWITPSHAILMYPSILFQVWFWTDKLQVLA